ncbi:hypothetical protein QR98_0092500 [Sarcoptes scabiei]|uniref:Uncharacterized protein n=1 Tax=Sarcoptes scabiei TaxID=52283 RepID=A0A132AJS4_SARSC|nr:hypothetical protein QR98_0092500 [Sarcoptes scabiei]
MRKALLKYSLIINNSFMATGGLYFAALTRWLWPTIIADYADYDWRRVTEIFGSLLITIRGRINELSVFGLTLFIPMVIIITMLIVHLIDNHIDFNHSDLFLIVMVVMLILIDMNIFFYIKILRSCESRAIGPENIVSSSPKLYE